MSGILSPSGIPILKSSGSILQVGYGNTGFVRQTINTAGPFPVNNLVAGVVASSNSSRMLVYAMLVCSYTYVCGVHIYREIEITPGSGSFSSVNVTASHGGNSQSGGDTSYWTHYQSSQESARSNQLFSMPIVYVDSPQNPNWESKTVRYQIRANSGWAGGTETLYINDRGNQDMLSCSSIVVMEIAG